MRFEVKEFKGIRPSRAADLLENGEAVLAQNCKLSGGVLEPLSVPGALTGGTVSVAAGTTSVYRFGQANASDVLSWFQSTLDCDFVKGPVVNDSEERTYWTDGVYPKKTNVALATSAPPYPSNSYRMGVPVPASAGAQALSGAATNAADPAETVIYCMTYVTAWGEEGPPCVVSSSLDIKPGMSVSFTALPVVPAGVSPAPNSANTAITGKRLYRSATGSSSTKFQLVNTEGDIDVAATTYTDSKLTRNLGDVLVTTGWIAPPDAMQGLCAMANGILAGFTGNTLCFSVPFAPYAWPLRYRQSVDAPIVGIMGFDQSLFVGTVSSVYIFTGTDPAQMTSERVPYAMSLTSKRSMVSMLGGVVFSAPTGLHLINSAGVKNLTRGYMTAAEWRNYGLSAMHSYEYEGRYLGFQGGGGSGGIIFTFNDNFSISTHDVQVTAGYRGVRTGALYVVSSLAPNTIQKWETGLTKMSQSWTSGIFNSPMPVNMGAARVMADAYPVTFFGQTDNLAVDSIIVNDIFPFRLPADKKGRRYSFYVLGTAVVREVVVATTMRELGQGDTRG